MVEDSSEQQRQSSAGVAPETIELEKVFIHMKGDGYASRRFPGHAKWEAETREVLGSQVIVLTHDDGKAFHDANGYLNCLTVPIDGTLTLYAE